MVANYTNKTTISKEIFLIVEIKIETSLITSKISLKNLFFSTPDIIKKGYQLLKGKISSGLKHLKGVS
jgi:hypothetical protein